MVSLAVVAIVSVLCFSVLSTFRKNAQGVQCINNLRILHVLTLSFIEDHQGKLPPSLGTATHIIPEYRINAYWWNSAYLGKYIAAYGSGGTSLMPEDLTLLRCPGRLVDGPDSAWNEKPEKITYLMSSPDDDPNEYRYRTLPTPSRRILYMEGRWSTVWKNVAKTGPPASRNTSRRLRRYHGSAINMIFMDGHAESFTGPDSEVASLLPK